jgi:hypothetical protein
MAETAAGAQRIATTKKTLKISEILTLDEHERDEYVRRMLIERIEHHERLEEERAARGEDAASDGQ